MKNIVYFSSVKKIFFISHAWNIRIFHLILWQKKRHYGKEKIRMSDYRHII
jgi:hypothetical protein